MQDPQSESNLPSGLPFCRPLGKYQNTSNRQFCFARPIFVARLVRSVLLAQPCAEGSRASQVCCFCVSPDQAVSPDSRCIWHRQKCAKRSQEATSRAAQISLEPRELIKWRTVLYASCSVRLGNGPRAGTSHVADQTVGHLGSTWLRECFGHDLDRNVSN